MLSTVSNRLVWLSNKFCGYKLQMMQSYYSFLNSKYQTDKEISIIDATRGRFGNKIFHLNNLLQIAIKYNRNPVSNYWKELNYLHVPSLIIRKPKPGIALSSENFYYADPEYLLESDQSLHLGNNFLHNFFFDFCVQSPRQLIYIKDIYKVRAKDKKNIVGLHIRGGDIISADGGQGFELHDISYYRRAVKYLVENHLVEEFLICTDDMEISTYHDVLNFLSENYGNEIKITLGLATKYPKLFGYIYDFAELTEVDYLISSSSTFSMAAGMLGRNKKIIHSKEWLYRINKRFVSEFNLNSKTNFILKNEKEFWAGLQKPNNYYYSDLLF